MDVTTRPWAEEDIADIVRYWTTLSPDDAERMGCDLSKFPSAEEYERILRGQWKTPKETATAFYSMWVLGGTKVGFASLKNINYGVRGEMHLHIWDESQRSKGLGSRFFCLSALDFYDRFKVKEIVCEPSASNPLPNRMLQKAGFPLIDSRIGRSSDLSMELPLHTYAITRDAAMACLNKAVVWDAEDYARNSRGQFGWAMSNIDKLALQPGERVLDVGCGDGKITVELAQRVPGGTVVGVDRSEEMIALAQRAASMPKLTFKVLDAQKLDFNEEFDAVFSNSAIHWMPDQQAVVSGIARALRRGGRIFLSMGGRGTAAIPREVLAGLTKESRWSQFLEGAMSPHHFKGPDQYCPWLEEAGLQAGRVELVSRPMRLTDVGALEGWLRTTWMSYLERLPETERVEFLRDWARRVAAKCSVAEDGALLMPMVNLEVESMK